MRPPFSSLPSIWMTMVCVIWVQQITYTSAYFIIEQPQANTQWVNNVSALITWTKGVGDGVTMFDLEMTSMSLDGLSLIARNVPTVPPQLNLLLVDVPPANDYFLLFINSTIGVMYATSPQFAILAASATPSATPPSPVAGVPTVTVSGGPNPTQPFATTFAASPNAAVALFTTIQANSLLITLLGCVLGAFLTLV